MNTIKNILICGLGAIGSVCATKIVQNTNVTLKVLADNKRIENYKKNPLVFNDKIYDFDYITPNAKNFEADLIIIATKNNAIPEVLQNIEPFINKNTIILSLLNGLKSEDDIAEKFGEEKTLYSYYIGHTSTRIDRKVFNDDVYKIVFGKKDNSTIDEQTQAVKAFFEEINIKYEIPIDMDYARWWKFLVNVGYNQASAVLNANYSAFQNSQKVNSFAIKLMEETAMIAKAEGVKNTEKMIPEVLKVIKTMLPQTRTSMLQDIDAKRQTEVDAFAGYVCNLGRKHNIKTPYNDMFLELIQAIDEKNSLQV